MKKLTLLITLLFLVNVSIADTYPKNPNIDIQNYVFKITLSDETDEIRCETTVEARFLKEGITTLRLDLINASPDLENKGMTVTRVISEGSELAYTHKDNGLIITMGQPSKANQLSKITISYSGVPADGLRIGNTKHGERTFFSDNWPNKGRNWLATVDHPYDKATCEFLVTAPAHYQVVSNGLLVEETDLDNGFRLTHWKQSVPIAPWLYVLGVARFAVQYVDYFDNKSIQTWVFHQDRDAGFYDFAEPTKKVLEFFSSYVGPFSYEKLANIQSNASGGGMEAASAIMYSDNSVVGDRNIRWRNVVIHELAHQWFGNAVTEYDWDDVWLSEGFATYFTLLFIEHEYGHDEFIAGLQSSKQRVDDFYEKNPEYRIVHDNLNDMSKVTSSQTYQKGSWTLHMLRGVVGTENFWKGIKSYYKKYQNVNANTADFKREMEEASGQDLSKFFDQWLYKPGTLKLDGTWQYSSKSKEFSINLNQVQKDGSLFTMPIEVAIFFKDQSQPEIKTLKIDQKLNAFTFKVESEPVKIILDPNSWVLMDSELKRK